MTDYAERAATAPYETGVGHDGGILTGTFLGRATPEDYVGFEIFARVAIAFDDGHKLLADLLLKEDQPLPETGARVQLQEKSFEIPKLPPIHYYELL